MKTDKRRECPQCHKLLSPQGFRGHVTYAHGVGAPERPASATDAPAPVEAPAAAAPAAAQAPPPDPLSQPAIDPAGLQELATPGEPAAPPADGEGASPKASAAVVHTRVDVGRALEGMVRQGDKVASKLAGIPEEKPADLDNIVDMMRPAAERMGDRMGPVFWILAFFLGLLSWAAYKVAAVRERRLQLAAGPAAAARADDSSRPAPRVLETHDRVSPYAQ